MILTPEQLRPGSELLKLYNLERVRGYLEKHPRASRKELCRELDLSPRTAAAHMKTVLEQQ